MEACQKGMLGGMTGHLQEGYRAAAGVGFGMESMDGSEVLRSDPIH